MPVRPHALDPLQGPGAERPAAATLDLLAEPVDLVRRRVVPLEHGTEPRRSPAQQQRSTVQADSAVAS